MNYQTLLLERAAGVATLSINRPQSLNALNDELLRELECAFAALERDAAVKAVIITGAGEKAFVAGADIKAMVALDPCQAQAFARQGQQTLLALEAMSKPVIAAVNGFALGGGLELALACDFIYAADKARFGLPEVTLGVIPGFGGTQNLARLIGKARANELIFTGRMIGADQALAWGIVNAVFPAAELLQQAQGTAAAIAAVGSLAVATAKDAIASGLNMTKGDGCRYEAARFGVLFASHDQKEGMAAFIDKRKPAFQGN